MSVPPVSSDCPKCDGSGTLRNVTVYEQHYIRRCRGCRYSETISLPPITKSVLYLDQSAISNMMKALNPAAPAHARGVHLDRWRNAFRRIDRLSKLQLLICPRSELHSLESMVSGDAAALDRMTHHLSGGIPFHEIEYIRLGQLLPHARTWVGGTPSPGRAPRRRDVFVHDPDAWSRRFDIEVCFPRSEDDRRRLRVIRDDGGEMLKTLSKTRWIVEPCSFDDWFREESSEYGRLVLERRAQIIALYSRVQAGFASPQTFDLNLLHDSSLRAVSLVRDEFRAAGVADDEIESKVREYFLGAGVQDLPFNRLSSLMFAACARKVRAGKKSPPNRGFGIDVRAISTYLPYCDAMFVDNECRGYLSEEPVRSLLGFPTKIFSVTKWDEFLHFLDEVEARARPEHLALVREVYGPKWEEPYETMYASASS